MIILIIINNLLCYLFDFVLNFIIIWHYYLLFNFTSFLLIFCCFYLVLIFSSFLFHFSSFISFFAISFLLC